MWSVVRPGMPADLPKTNEDLQSAGLAVEVAKVPSNKCYGRNMLYFLVGIAATIAWQLEVCSGNNGITNWQCSAV